LTTAPVGGEWSASSPEKIIKQIYSGFKGRKKSLSHGLKDAEPYLTPLTV
jgi:hypothetical protein